jgi:type II secretory pathway pseudopilin PulG
LLVVIAIIAALMAIIVPSYRTLSEQNNRASCAAKLKAIGQGLALFREDYKCFPPDATEFLWTEEALAQYREAYGADPPGDSSPATLIGAAYDEAGNPINTGVRGLGLLTLYYLGAYSAAPPPPSSDPRLLDNPDSLDPVYRNLRSSLEASGKGLNGLLWFRGSGYITELDTFHCPANETKLYEYDLVERDRLPYIGGWNSYDIYYRRNFWHPGRPIPGVTDNRNLFQPYPPADTVVTWCPHHRSSHASSGPGVPSDLQPGDQDLVLFADGSVRRMVSQRLNQMYREPAAGAGWPEGPIM